jgi:signal transduction histidine kinase
MGRMSSANALNASAASPWPARLERWHLPPPKLLRLYLLIWAPIFLIHMVAVETDGQLTRSFDLMTGLKAVARNLGPQFCLLLLLWPLTGWMERRRLNATVQVLVHLLMALSFAVICYASLWLVMVLQYGFAAAEKARGNWFIWMIQWGAMMYAVAAGGFTAWRAVQRALAQTAAAEQAHTLLARTELAALRNKLNPHFLFNTLHSILALVRKDAKRAEAALFRFSEMLRYILDTERSGSDQVPLREELAFTEQYLQLEAIRLGERLQLDWDVDESALGGSIPALTVQPLVENSIKHAFNPHSRPGHLRVKVSRSGEQVEIEVADDGPGCQLSPDGSLPPGSGLGLPTVQRRLQLQYGAAAQFVIASTPGAGFSVRLQIPVNAP